MLVKSWNCVVGLHFDPLNLIGLIFDCCLIPMPNRLHDPEKMRAHFASIVIAFALPMDLSSMTIESMNWLAIMGFERSMMSDLVAAKMDTAFEMVCHYFQHCYCFHSLNSCLPFDFSPHRYCQMDSCRRAAENCENHCCLEGMPAFLMIADFVLTPFERQPYVIRRSPSLWSNAMGLCNSTLEGCKDFK